MQLDDCIELQFFPVPEQNKIMVIHKYNNSFCIPYDEMRRSIRKRGITLNVVHTYVKCHCATSEDMKINVIYSGN